MKFSLTSSLITLLFIIGFNSGVFGQYFFHAYFSFEEVPSNQLVIDSNSIWQIGQPQKIILNSGYNSPKAIITDTINSYPNNDTSTFFIYTGFPKFTTGDYKIAFKFKTDTDTLLDYLKIEISGDNGQTWFDLLKDKVTYNAFTTHNVISGRITNWETFNASLNQWFNDFSNSYPTSRVSDTLITKFSFISDNINNNREGVLIDSLVITHRDTNITFIGEEEKINYPLVFPNPFLDFINIQNLTNNSKVFIYDVRGNQVALFEHLSKYLSINLAPYPKGIYFIRIQSYDITTNHKIIKL